MMLPNDSISLPVAETFCVLDDLGTLFDTDALRYPVPEIVFSVAFGFFLVPGKAQVLIGVSMCGLVLPDVPIYLPVPAPCDLMLGIDLHSSGDSPALSHRPDNSHQG